MSTSVLQQKIISAKSEGRQALVFSVPAGFPQPDSFFSLLEELDANGADIIEIGVPYSDPAADGPLAEEASRNALSSKINLKWIFKVLSESAGKLKSGIVLAGYMNPFLQYGLENFAADAGKAGVSGCLVQDLPLEESDIFRNILSGAGLDLIHVLGPNTSIERMKEYAGALLKGYVHIVPHIGAPGEGESMQKEMLTTLERAGSSFALPLVLDADMESLGRLKKLAPAQRPDALSFNEAFLKHIKNGGKVTDFMSILRA